ncbi:MAG: hypothetical protein HWN68_05330 [Desulfobacterales bacterium]|nr:hypothetical protein [Desulfobacterales bacterium]
MDHFTVSYGSGGNAIYTELEDRVEKIFTQFGYELWFAAHDPMTGLRELAFGKVKSNDLLQSRRYANTGQS